MKNIEIHLYSYDELFTHDEWLEELEWLERLEDDGTWEEEQKENNLYKEWERFELSHA